MKCSSTSADGREATRRKTERLHSPDSAARHCTTSRSILHNRIRLDFKQPIRINKAHDLHDCVCRANIAKKLTMGCGNGNSSRAINQLRASPVEMIKQPDATGTLRDREHGFVSCERESDRGNHAGNRQIGGFEVGQLRNCPSGFPLDGIKGN